MGRKETPIQRATIDALNLLPRTKVWRQQSGKVRVKNGWMQLAPVGAADIVGVAHGLHIEFEVKAPGEESEQSDEQKEWAADIEMCGGIYLLTIGPEYAVADLRAALRERGIKA